MDLDTQISTRSQQSFTILMEESLKSKIEEFLLAHTLQKSYETEDEYINMTSF